METKTLQPTASIRDLVELDDWSLIVATMHHNGSHRRTLSAEQIQNARAEGDGYGGLQRYLATYRKDWTMLTCDELNLLEQVIVEGDWSHIRDSSPSATARIAVALRKALRAKM